MKAFKTLLALLVVSTFTMNAVAQDGSSNQGNQPPNNEFQISARLGYDLLQWYNNETPYIDYKGGLMLGLSLDHFWNKIGLGLDFDFIKNKPKSIFPITNLWSNPNQQLGSFSLTEESINRMFLGIGPGLRLFSQDRKLAVQFHLRGGIGLIKGGLTELTGLPLQTTAPPSPIRLNYHAGYDQSMVLSGKAQIKFTYFLSDNFGLNLGAYYIHHFGVVEENIGNISGYYYNYTSDAQGLILDPSPVIRRDPLKHDISSLGIFAGVTLKLGTTSKPCIDCTANLEVTARDKYTNQVLPGTEVVVKNQRGQVVKTGTTNSFGVVNFEGISADDYVIEGKLHGVDLEPAAAMKSEFRAGRTLRKVIYYADRSFIIQGKTIICNTTTALPNVNVTLENTSKAFKKTTISDAQGNFMFHMPEEGTYTLFGKKTDFFSQIVELDARGYNRNRNLYVTVELCAQEIECDRNVRLDNIHYDFDQHFIREDAKPDLDKLVRFMLDFPTVNIELSSHTDSRGSDEYNMALSQRRANAAVDYIVSRGINRNRLIARGYGESRLLNRCSDGVQCSEAEHQLNRRTEFKVICP